MFLIDGYNLMHALGLAPQPVRLSLERSRLRLIDYLAAEMGSAAANVCLVFDSKRSDGNDEQIHRGVFVLFTRGETADDLIERLIREEKVPAELIIVSNDQRLRHAAERKGCPAWTCGEFIDWIAAGCKSKQADVREAIEPKPQAMTNDEMREWLDAFGAANDHAD
jgi:predicted RNA-binding protein with PIN domain